MRVLINGQPLNTAASAGEIGADIYRWLGDIIAYPIDSAWNGILNFFKNFFKDLFITPLNNHSSEIITLALIFCAAGMMVGSVFGKTNWWLNWLFVVLGGGIIWRVVI